MFALFLIMILQEVIPVVPCSMPKEKLLGLAFDGNWEAMSSDIVFEPDLQRCIGVDVRYMLFYYGEIW